MPGYTDTDKALRILRSSKYVAFGDVDFQTIKMTLPAMEFERAQWRNARSFIAFYLLDSRYINSATFQSHVVESIIVRLGYHLRLDEFIQKYGEPEKLVREVSTVTLLYPHQGLAIVVKLKWHREGEYRVATLEKSCLVTTALYFVPASMSDLLQHPPYRLWLGGTGEKGGILRNWEGYGQEIWRVAR